MIKIQQGMQGQVTVIGGGFIMTISQLKRFYEQDSREYELKKNKNFLNWLQNTINYGYHNFISIDELQKLINNIVNWYELKYPEKELEYFEGRRYMNFQDIKSISDVMDIRQLLFRLPHNQLYLMECGYRAKYIGSFPIYENDKEISSKVQICMPIYRKNEDESHSLFEKLPHLLLRADSMTGEVLNGYEIDEYLDSDKSINLDELLSVFNEKYSDELDFIELKESVYDHHSDMELRYKVLQLVALKLLYSKNTFPERGYKRAKRFINEFNKELGLTLSTAEIDEIMHRDYTDGERWEWVTNAITDENGEEFSYTTSENIARKEIFPYNPKKLIKSIFGKK